EVCQPTQPAAKQRHQHHHRQDGEHDPFQNRRHPRQPLLQGRERRVGRLVHVLHPLGRVLLALLVLFSLVPLLLSLSLLSSVLVLLVSTGFIFLPLIPLSLVLAVLARRFTVFVFSALFLAVLFCLSRFALGVLLRVSRFTLALGRRVALRRVFACLALLRA